MVTPRVTVGRDDPGMVGKVDMEGREEDRLVKEEVKVGVEVENLDQEVTPKMGGKL